MPAVTGYLSKMLVDDLTLRSASGAGQVGWLAGGVAAGAGLTAVLTALAGLTTTASGRSVKMLAQDRLYRRINGFKGLRPFEDPATQDSIRLAEQASQDAPRQVLDFSLTALRAATTIAGFLGTVLAVWPLMGLLLVGCVAASSAGQLWLARRQVDSMQRSMADVRRQFIYRTLLLDRRSATEIRLFGAGPEFHRRTLDSLRNMLDVEVGKARRDAATQSALALLTAVAAGAAGAAVAEQVWHGHLTIGEMALFTAAVTSVQGALATILVQFGRTDQALRLFAEYLKIVEAPDDLPDGGRRPERLRHGITLEDVWFRYGQDEPWVLRGLDLHLTHGETVGLVGVNGAGKSTLIKLLCRFYEPIRGRILWDGVDIRELSTEELRARIGVTFQDYMTYDMTARDNIGVGQLEHMSDLERIRAAAGLAEIDDVLIGLPDGYQTLLSRTLVDPGQDTGVLLSGGQWQRVALARSLLRDDADLLILDEPSSGLDALAERRVHDTLARHRAGRTSLLVSHRLASLRKADRIIVLAAGRIAEQGSHQELLVLDGRYAELFRTQAEGYQLLESAPAGAGL
ncbi:ABC transporter ATP-binding protein [Streptacidiphilus sp. EB103A]|uniref:ABC transporter ATP-binding protein n=1 Tax=Streptacidiphilus sp. EB103A TaxID=3156275 RepID=UPI003518B0E6